MTSCSTVAEGFLNQVGRVRKRKRSHWSRGVASPTRMAKGWKGSVTEIVWISGTSGCAASAVPTRRYPGVTGLLTNRLVRTWTTWSLPNFAELQMHTKKPCLLENRQSLAQLLTCQLPLAQTQHSAGTGSQQRCNWAAIDMYQPCLFWSQGWFCLKLQKSAILPVRHISNPLPLNHSEYVQFGRVLSICCVVFYCSEGSIESKGWLTV